jgi:hypothetical protein
MQTNLSIDTETVEFHLHTALNRSHATLAACSDGRPFASRIHKPMKSGASARQAHW